MHPSSLSTTVVDRPLIHFGREICGDLPSALRREWLVTNGLGGYASGTLAGVNTRSYHGLLVAALNPPVDRTVLVGGLLEWATYEGKRYPLSTNAYVDGTMDPRSYVHLEAFSLEGTIPVWTFAFADALLERRIWMEEGANTTYVSYRLLRCSDEVHLTVTPLVTYRSFHALSSGQGWQIEIDARQRDITIHAFDGAVPFTVAASAGSFVAEGSWWWNFKYRAETERGLNDRGDLYAPGSFSTTLRVAEHYALTLSSEPGVEPFEESTYPRARERQKRLLRAAGMEQENPALQQLTLAADQFIVRRRPAPGAAEEETRSIIAGYHWFNDWGRDTMISLPGLTLTTARHEDAASILRGFSRYVSDGLLPNNFPDQAGIIPGYNTADATLWYIIAVHAYAQTSGDTALVDALLPVLRDIVDWHTRGTRYYIGVDPADGLLQAGEPGVQLTWMDAKIGDLVVTPRIGKPVEINALWYNALRILAAFLAARGDSDAVRYEAQADRAHAAFTVRFLRAGQSSLADVIDGPNGDDWTVRPNQIFAVSLPFPLLEGAAAAGVVQTVGRTLLTSYGLRSLGPDDPAYRGSYGGDQYQRDTTYHQGPVWPWLIGAFVEAHRRVYHDDSAAVALLRPFADHLLDAGLGSISEIMEGDAPHLPRGCVAQAWSVAEVLRVWHNLERDSHIVPVEAAQAELVSSGSSLE